MDLDLTKRQKEIFDFIRRYAAKTGYPPTVREIGKAVGLHSSSTVHAHLANLENKLRERLGTKVHLRYAQGKGALEIVFFSDAELERILQIVGVSPE